MNRQVLYRMYQFILYLFSAIGKYDVVESTVRMVVFPRTTNFSRVTRRMVSSLPPQPPPMQLPRTLGPNIFTADDFCTQICLINYHQTLVPQQFEHKVFKLIYFLYFNLLNVSCNQLKYMNISLRLLVSNNAFRPSQMQAIFKMGMILWHDRSGSCFDCACLVHVT